MGLGSNLNYDELWFENVWKKQDTRVSHKLSQDAFQSLQVAAFPLHACLQPLQNGGKAAKEMSLDFNGTHGKSKRAVHFKERWLWSAWILKANYLELQWFIECLQVSSWSCKEPS